MPFVEPRGLRCLEGAWRKLASGIIPESQYVARSCKGVVGFCSAYGSAAAAETQDQVQGRLLLDVVVGERAAVLELLASKDQALLVRRDALLVLDLRLHVVDRVRRLDVEGDGLAREGLHEDLHAAAETQHQVQRRLLLDVVVGERA